jgi:hypothetical protein
MTHCQQCARPLTAGDLAADPYTDLCEACWRRWESEIPDPLTRYGKPGTVCTACGQGFGGVWGFDMHRHQGRCLSPGELAGNPRLKVQDGVWIGLLKKPPVIAEGNRETDVFSATPYLAPTPSP